jgi:hypothetical protein
VGITGLLSDIYHCFVGSGTGYPFSLFPTEYYIELFFEESCFHSFFFPSVYLVLCNYVFGRLVGGFDCLFSFPDLIFVLCLT